MRDRPVVIPKAVRQKAAAHGAEGRRWLRRLGGVIQQLEHDWDVAVRATLHWDVAVGATLHGGSESYVAQATPGDGVQTVIKLAIPGNDLAGETTVLRLADGHGYARLPATMRCQLRRRPRPGHQLRRPAYLDAHGMV